MELRAERPDPGERIRLLLITNELTAGAEYGFRDEFDRLWRDGLIDSYSAIAPRALAAQGADWMVDLHGMLRAQQPNVVLVLSPSAFALNRSTANAIAECGAHLLYWEGDAWGRGKPMTAAMRSWAERSDVVFSVAGSPQTDEFIRLGARSARVILQTYCHVQFKEFEDCAPEDSLPSDDIAMIASSTARFGLISRVAGGTARVRAVRHLSRLRDLRMSVYGYRWNGAYARGPVAYGAQVGTIRRARISVNWDHFPSHANYSSDRLPISLLAGRVHVTTRHPGSLPYATDALVEVSAVDTLADTVVSLLDLPWEELYERGRAGWEYARYRLSDREAARFILRAVDQRLPAPPSDPWLALEEGVLATSRSR